MFLAAVLLSFLQLASNPGDQVIQHSQKQAENYLQNIEEGRNVDENLWALTQLSTNHKEIRNHVEKLVQTNSYTADAALLFKAVEQTYLGQLQKVVFQTGSQSLLIDLLLKTEDKQDRKNIFQRFQSQFGFRPSEDGLDFQVFAKAVLNEESIKVKSISNPQFQLTHFLILYENDDLLPEKFIESAITNWQSNEHKNNDLRYTLSTASYLVALYLRYEYAETTQSFRPLINDQLFPNSPLKLRLYRWLDYSMYTLGYFDRSLEVVRNFTLPLSDYLDRNNQKIQIELSKGVYLYSIGKIKAAEKVYQNLLAKVDKDDPAVRLSSLYNNLALTYNKLGKYDEYLNLQFQALEVAENDDNYNHQIDIFRNLFIYYRQNNNEENAFEYLSKAQELAKEEGNITDLGNLYVSQGASIRQFNNNYQKAFDYFAKAEEILDPKNNSENYIFLLNEQANTFEKQKKYSDAIEKYDRILTLLPEDNPNHLDALVNKALNHLDLGNIDKAGELITKFQSYDLSKLEFQQIIKAKTVEADYLHSVGKSERALDILEPALRQVVVRAKSSADLKSGYWYVEDEYLDAFELIVAIYKQNNKLDQAIEKLDQLKTINDASLYQNPLVKSSLLNESQLTEYKQLTNQLDATRKKLLTAPEDQKLGIRQNISQLKLKKRNLDRKLTAQIQSDPITIREVRNNLSARELVMHITELNDQYYIAKISRSNVELNTIPLDSTQRNLLSGAVQQVATNQTNLDTLYTISNMLKLKQIPDRIEQVTLIPDSYFYQLPIDILPLQQPAHSYSYGQVTYAIEQFRTQYLTSLDDLKSEAPAQTKSQNNLSYTGFGVSNFSGYNKKSLVPLPHAKTEINNIAGQLTNMSKVNTYINNQSTKPIFKQAAPKSEIIHLATHSEVSERDPMFSTVYLSKRANTADSTFDDQLFAYELFELNLSNEMIMLNSCESGSGPYIQGTGVMGISRALQYAGARSLILNLWSVNDQLAADFATHFYEQLNKGKSKAEAMRTTKRYFLKTKNASPHFWGPYMLIGNDNPIIQPDREKNLAMAGAFIFYFLLMVGLSYLAQQGNLFRDSKQNNV